ncbi:hypothetical protein BCh11DRAFT_06435 [Burkholderia sp. Ch1-1]|nr:hypothetical protein BCh11DRAFT_06435 [Burkholderia sp. Ch1-1]
MTELIFDPVEHSYTVGAQRVPGVTATLAPLVDFSMVPKAVLERAQQLGTAVHRMVELDNRKDLDEDSVSDELLPFLTAYRRFRAETGFVPELIEQRFHHPVLRFAGTLDITGSINRRSAVVDIKKMLTLGPVVGVQLAAYQELCRVNGHEVLDRYGLGLRKDGTYRLVPFKDKGDWPTFLSLLTLRNFKDKHGLAEFGGFEG